MRAAALRVGFCCRLDERRDRAGGRSATALRRCSDSRDPRGRPLGPRGRAPSGRAAPYPLPRGGATPIGAVGYAFAAQEIAEQSAALGIQLDTVVVATGSGATQAGLVAGQAGYGLSWHVIGASVSRPIAEATERVRALAKACAAELGFRDPNPDDVDVRDLRGAGFGIASPTDRISAELALTAEALLLDDHYGAQALTLLRHVLAEERPGSAVFWYDRRPGGGARRARTDNVAMTARRRGGPPEGSAARELIDSGFALENADAPFLHAGLNLADIAHVLDLLRRGIVPRAAARDLLTVAARSASD